MHYRGTVSIDSSKFNSIKENYFKTVKDVVSTAGISSLVVEKTEVNVGNFMNKQMVESVVLKNTDKSLSNIGTFFFLTLKGNVVSSYRIDQISYNYNIILRIIFKIVPKLKEMFEGNQTPEDKLRKIEDSLGSFSEYENFSIYRALSKRIKDSANAAI